MHHQPTMKTSPKPAKATRNPKPAEAPLDLTPMHHHILRAIVKLRHDHPEFNDIEAETIRKALWEAWHIAYRIEEMV
jgi:hypothetical protein